MGQAEDGMLSHAFRWTQASGTVIVASGGQDAVLALSSNGARGVGFDDPFPSAVVWSNAAPPTVVHPFAAVASAISPSGRRVAGAAVTAPGLLSEVYRHNPVIDAFELLGFNGTPRDIDNRWRMVGATGIPPVVVEAFLWTPGGGLQLLGDLPGGGTQSQARAIAKNGNLVVGWGTSANSREAFVWTPASGMERAENALATLGVSLPAGTLLRSIDGMSQDGRTLVGVGFDPGVGDAAFLLELP